METESLVSSEFSGHFYLFIFWLQAVNRVLNTLLLLMFHSRFFYWGPG